MLKLLEAQGARMTRLLTDAEYAAVVGLSDKGFVIVERRTNKLCRAMSGNYAVLTDAGRAYKAK